jgi:hypothetical protein
VQLQKLGSSGLVSAKFNDLMKNMRAFAQEVTAKNRDVQGVTEGLLTPKRRFTKDLDVPPCTRCGVPQSLIDATYEASTADMDDMDRWDEKMSQANEMLNKMVASQQSDKTTD